MKNELFFQLFVLPSQLISWTIGLPVFITMVLFFSITYLAVGGSEATAGAITIIIAGYWRKHQ